MRVTIEQIFAAARTNNPAIKTLVDSFKPYFASTFPREEVDLTTKSTEENLSAIELAAHLGHWDVVLKLAATSRAYVYQDHVGEASAVNGRALLVAVERGESAVIEALLKAAYAPTIERYVDSEQTAAHRLVQTGQVDILKSLLARNINFLLADNSVHQNPMTLAAANGSWELVALFCEETYFVKARTQVNFKKAYGKLLLSCVVSSNPEALAAFKILLNFDPTLAFSRNASGKSLVTLIMAMEDDVSKAEYLKFLLDLDYPVVHELVRQNDIPSLKLLFAHDPSLLMRKDSAGKTILESALVTGYEAMMKFLVQSMTHHFPAEVMSVELYVGAMCTALAAGNLDRAESILRMAPGSVSDHSALYGRLVFEAIKASKIDLARRLVEAGASVDYRDASGNCALHHAAVQGSAEMMSLSLDKDPKQLTEKNVAGLTPIQAAFNAGKSTEFIKCFIALYQSYLAEKSHPASVKAETLLNELSRAIQAVAKPAPKGSEAFLDLLLALTDKSSGVIPVRLFRILRGEERPLSANLGEKLEASGWSRELHNQYFTLIDFWSAQSLAVTRAELVELVTNINLSGLRPLGMQGYIMADVLSPENRSKLKVSSECASIFISQWLSRYGYPTADLVKSLFNPSSSLNFYLKDKSAQMQGIVLEKLSSGPVHPARALKIILKEALPDEHSRRMSVSAKEIACKVISLLESNEESSFDKLDAIDRLFRDPSLIFYLKGELENVRTSALAIFSSNSSLCFALLGSINEEYVSSTLPETMIALSNVLVHFLISLNDREVLGNALDSTQALGRFFAASPEAQAKIRVALDPSFVPVLTAPRVSAVSAPHSAIFPPAGAGASASARRGLSRDEDYGLELQTLLVSPGSSST